MTKQPWEAVGPLKAVFGAAVQRRLEHWRRGPSRTRWATTTRTSLDSIHEAATD